MSDRVCVQIAVQVSYTPPPGVTPRPPFLNQARFSTPTRSQRRHRCDKPNNRTVPGVDVVSQGD